MEIAVAGFVVIVILSRVAASRLVDHLVRRFLADVLGD